MRFRCTGPDGTFAAAQALAARVPEAGLVVALVGPLGAGKTAFVKGLAAGLGFDPAAVSSPTFVIANQYIAAATGGRDLAHVDLYRLATEAELDGIGFADLLAPGAVVAIEWADRLPDALPRDHLEVRIEREGGDERSRSLSASATGKGSQIVLEAWEAGLAGLPNVVTRKI